MSGALGRLKDSYTTGARGAASRLMSGMADSWITPNKLTAAGVTLCLVAAVVVWFENHSEHLYFWLGAALFIVGSVLDILDGALARATGQGTPFGAFIDSTTDRIGEAAMVAAVGLVFMRDGKEWALAVAFAAMAGSFLVSYARARAEALGLRGDVGLSSRAERVVIISAGLILAPWGALPWAIALLAASAWVTVVQRALSVRAQLRRAG
jgi:CDP-diacylglycerol--glycerol-3-phosphate 3-phosphatidyltransferase